MKKLLISLCIAAAIVACKKETPQTTTTTTTTTIPPPTPPTVSKYTINVIAKYYNNGGNAPQVLRVNGNDVSSPWVIKTGDVVYAAVIIGSTELASMEVFIDGASVYKKDICLCEYNLVVK